MNPRYVLAAALSMSLLAGCQSAREAYMVDAINAQDLILEDKIYELSNRLDELEARLELRGNRLPRSTDAAGSDEIDDSSAPSSGSMAPDEEEDTDLTPPEVEPGTPADPEDVPSPDGDDVDNENTSTARKTSFEESPNDRDVMELSINEVRPANFDRQPGDDGILVVLEPKNADGETVLDPAMIEIKIGDPTDRCHYGPWEFPPDAVANCVQNTDKVQAIVLQVPWDKIPQHNKLDLFVQYTRPDGERLQNRTRFNTNLHESVASRWSARGASTAPRQLPQVVPAPMIDDQEDGPPVDVYQ